MRVPATVEEFRFLLQMQVAVVSKIISWVRAGLLAHHRRRLSVPPNPNGKPIARLHFSVVRRHLSMDHFLEALALRWRHLT